MVHWGRKVVPKKRQCHMQIFIPPGGVIVDCSWEFDVILSNGFFLLRTLSFLTEAWDVKIVENKGLGWWDQLSLLNLGWIN